MAAEHTPLLTVKHLRKEFDGVVALAGVSLEVPEGEVLGLIGPNGAGKTTFFNVISGLHLATDGEVRLRTTSLLGLPQYKVAALGLARTFQNLQIFGSMTVLENVLLGCHRHGRQGLFATLLRFPAVRKEEQFLHRKALEALEFLGLESYASQRAGDLPPGLQRLVEIARALASDPCLLLLDEPAAGLTTRETETLGERLSRIAATGLTTILIEHDMSLVMQICRRVAVLDEGKLLAIGTPQEIQSNEAVIAAYLGGELVL